MIQEPAKHFYTNHPGFHPRDSCSADKSRAPDGFSSIFSFSLRKNKDHLTEVKKNKISKPLSGSYEFRSGGGGCHQNSEPATYKVVQDLSDPTQGPSSAMPPVDC